MKKLGLSLISAIALMGSFLIPQIGSAQEEVVVSYEFPCEVLPHTVWNPMIRAYVQVYSNTCAMSVINGNEIVIADSYRKTYSSLMIGCGFTASDGIVYYTASCMIGPRGPWFSVREHWVPIHPEHWSHFYHGSPAGHDDGRRNDHGDRKVVDRGGGRNAGHGGGRHKPLKEESDNEKLNEQMKSIDGVNGDEGLSASTQSSSDPSKDAGFSEESKAVMPTFVPGSQAL